MKHVLLVLALSLAPAAAQAQRAGQGEFGDRRLAAIDDPLRVSFMGDAAKLTTAEVRRAIEVAGLAKDWKVVGASDGRTELQTTKNGRHVLHVVVTYGTAGVTIDYIESVDMMYQEQRQRGRPVRVIHRNYNVWVRELGEAIGNALRQPVKLAVAAAPTRVSAPKLTHNRRVPPPSGFAAIDDVDKVPVREAGKDRYRFYLKVRAPKAFVVMAGGGWRMYYSNADAIAMALDHCERTAVGCWLYAVDDKVVYTADPAKRISKVEQLPRVAP